MNSQGDVHVDVASITQQYREIADAVCARLAQNRRVRRRLPGGGRLRVDRQLPFLCLHRGMVGKCGSANELITTQAAYLFASDDADHHAGLCYLCTAIISAMREHFGMFLLIEIWTDEQAMMSDTAPFKIEIVASDAQTMPSTIGVLQESLESIVMDGRSAHVEIREMDSHEVLGVCCPATVSGRTKLAGESASCCELGLAVTPIYLDHDSGTLFPLVLQSLRRQLAVAIRKSVAEFTGAAQTQMKSYIDALGPSSYVRAVGRIDQQLCEVSESYDFLLQLTPINAAEAWEGFKESGFETLPPLMYRHLPYHPNILKRRLFEIEIERVEDPTLAYLFWEKQNEIDRQLSVLRDLHLPETTLSEHSKHSRVLLGSLQLYGAPENSLVDLASEIIKRLSEMQAVASSCENEEDLHRSGRFVNAVQFTEVARDEIDHYHQRMSEFTATVEISTAIASGVMVSQGRLLISPDSSIAGCRVDALLHHEIGTHLLTYFNGRCQPLRQLYAGLSGYEELQEGLAVLAEYLVGGLTPTRLRTLAGRVLAVHWMAAGEPFASVFERLCALGFTHRQSFTTTLRVFRGGGLTKDLIYLRGLRDLLDYLAAGHDIEPLYVGKIGLPHVPYIQELRRRGIITAPRILPRFWADISARDRLEACRGKSVLGLLENAS